jgi:hypothetical protein
LSHDRDQLNIRDDGSYSIDVDDAVPEDGFLSVVSATGETLARKKLSTLIDDASPDGSVPPPSA